MASEKASKPSPEQVSAPLPDPAALPPLVGLMRARILAACETGDIERLRIPVEWNETPPLFVRGLKKGPGFDPARRPEGAILRRDRG